MNYFVLTYTGEEPIPDEDIIYFNERTVVLGHSDHNLLVNDSQVHLSQMLLAIPRWKAERVLTYKRFDFVSLAPLG